MTVTRLLAGVRVIDGSGSGTPARACVRILAQLGASIIPWTAAATSDAEIWVRGEEAVEGGATSGGGLPGAARSEPVVVVLDVTLTPRGAGQDLPDSHRWAGADLDHPGLVLLTGAHAAVAALGALRWARRERLGTQAGLTQRPSPSLGERGRGQIPAQRAGLDGTQRPSPPSGERRKLRQLASGVRGQHAPHPNIDSVGCFPLTPALSPSGGEGADRQPAADVASARGVRVAVTATEVLAACLGEALHPALCPRAGASETGQAQTLTVLRCADGWVGIALPTPLHRELFARLTGVPAVADPTADLASSLRDWLGERTRDDVFHAAQLWQLPVVPVLTPAEVVRDEQGVARGMWPTENGLPAFPVENADRRPFHFQARSPFRVRRLAQGRASSQSAKSRRSDRGTPPPTSAAILAGDYDANGGASRPPLADVRVLDLGMVWAGPYCGRLLAALGADVVKIEGPRHADGTRPSAGRACAGMFADLNGGKASLALDLSVGEGRDLVLRLVEQADVVVESFSPRVMPNFGLDPATLAAANPALVSLAMPAFGSTGPWASYVAYGGGLELVTGLAGLDASGSPVAAAVPYLDYLAGAYGAAAVLAALLARDATGVGGRLEVAQREVACQVLALAGETGLLDVDTAAPARWRYGVVDAAAIVADPFLQTSGLFAAPPAPHAGCVHFARLPWRSAELPAPAARPAPALGADTRTILHGAGLADAAIERLTAAGIVLDAPSPKGARA